MSDTMVSALVDLSKESGADAISISALLGAVPAGLPQEYLRLLRIANGASGSLRNRYLIVFSSQEAIDVNQRVATYVHCPGFFVFASNGGGTVYLLKLGLAETSPVFSLEEVDLGIEAPRRIAASVEEFVRCYGPNVD